MINDPVEHLLMTLYTMYQWGEPAEKSSWKGISHSAVTQAKNPDVEETTYQPRPTVIFSEEKCPFAMPVEINKLPENLFDLLGAYQVKNYNTKGTIFLYEACIQEIGLLFYINAGRVLRMSRSYCINLVREIVLWHQLGHWITHWMPGKDHNRWNRKSYLYNDMSKDVHEALAQVFVQFAIQHIEDDNKRNHFQIIFHYLLHKQQKYYSLYNQLLKHPRFGWNNLLGAITMLRILENPEDVTIEYLLNNLTTN